MDVDTAGGGVDRHDAYDARHTQPAKRPGEASPALNLGMVEELAVCMFAVGADKPMAASRALAGASVPTVGLAVIV